MHKLISTAPAPEYLLACHARHATVARLAARQGNVFHARCEADAARRMWRGYLAAKECPEFVQRTPIGVMETLRCKPVHAFKAAV